MTPQHEILDASPLLDAQGRLTQAGWARAPRLDCNLEQVAFYPVSYTHLRAHETVLDLVCRLLLEKKNEL